MLRTTKLFAVLSVWCSVVSCKKEKIAPSQQEKTTIETQKKTAENSLVKNIRYKKFQGAWFSIEYPENFKAQNSLPSETYKDAYDSAVFSSPDGNVQFYVFSPQWSGVAKDIALKANESQIVHTEETQNGLQIIRWIIKASDDSYYRSYESTSETASKINKVFGIKYRSENDLEKYKDAYLHFKNSLQQYAD